MRKLYTLLFFGILFNSVFTSCTKMDDAVVAPKVTEVAATDSWWGDTIIYQQYPTLKSLANIPYAADIVAFGKKDSIQKTQLGGNVFAGSSSIRLWDDLETCFPGKNVLKRGTGGSTISELLNFQAPYTIFKYLPRAVFIYSGENDIAGGAEAKDVATNFVKLYFYIRKNIPQTKIYYLSIKTSNSRIAMRSKFEAANEQIKKFLDKSSVGKYLDVNKVLMDKNGNPDDAFFGPDHLHLNSKGYDLWKPIISPYLQ